MPVIARPGRGVTAEPGDLWVGVGQPGVGGLVGAQVLNHKCSVPRTTSLSQHLAQADDAMVAGWRRQWPTGIAGVQRLVLEDASPDTCLALLLFARLVSPDASTEVHRLGAVVPAADAARLVLWVDYIDAWEQGKWPDAPNLLPGDVAAAPALTHNGPTGAPELAVLARSTVCLLSALAHSLISHQPDGSRVPNAAGHAEALRACLTLLDACIATCTRPEGAAPPAGLPETALALALLQFEYQNYLLALKHGIRTQLSVPLATTGRRVLVDALLLDDVELGGITKVLARHDARHTWTGQGFALLGLRRPALKGNGFEMTVSVDPRTGLSLQLLWQRLEALEDERWAGARPRDAPRRGIVGYTDGRTGAVMPGAPSQPWYDGGNFTLVAGPHALADGRSGTQLDWLADVLPALWQLYPPFPQALTAGPAEQTAGRRIVVVHWPKAFAAAAGRTPALHSWLAACSGATPARHPGELMPAAQFQVVSLPGGDALVHAEGVTLFDDWSSTPLDINGLAEVARSMATLAQRYQRLLRGGALAALLDEEHAALAAPQRIAFRQLSALRNRALALKAEMTLLAAQELAASEGHGAEVLRSALERAWGLPEARHRLAETVGQLDTLVGQAWSLLQERRQFWGTAVVSGAALFYVLRDGLAAWASYATANLYETLIPIARALKVDNAKLDELGRNADLAELFDLATLVALGAVVSGGMILAVLRYTGGWGRKRDVLPPNH